MAASAMTCIDMTEGLQKAAAKSIADVLKRYSDDDIRNGVNGLGFTFNMALEVERCNFFMSSTAYGPSFMLRMDVPTEILRTITRELEKRSGIQAIVDKHGGSFTHDNPRLFGNILMTGTTFYINGDLVKPTSAKSSKYGSGAGLVGLIFNVKKHENGTIYFKTTVKLAVLEMESSIAAMRDDDFLANI